jgi:hypothetical protein
MKKLFQLVRSFFSKAKATAQVGVVMNTTEPTVQNYAVRETAEQASQAEACGTDCAQDCLDEDDVGVETSAVPEPTEFRKQDFIRVKIPPVSKLGNSKRHVLGDFYLFLTKNKRVAKRLGEHGGRQLRLKQVYVTQSTERALIAETKRKAKTVARQEARRRGAPGYSRDKFNSAFNYLLLYRPNTFPVKRGGYAKWMKNGYAYVGKNFYES